MSTVSMRRVVITGMGAISPLGVGAETLWQGLREGRSAIGPLRHPDAERLRVKIAAQVPDSFDPTANIEERTLIMLDRTSEFALHAAREAIAQSGLDFSQNGLGVRTAVVVGTGVGGENTQDEQSKRLYGENSPRAHPLTIVRVMTNASASQISIAYGLRGPTFAVSSACASANHAIIQAAQMIRYGLADAAITGGTEACLTYGALRAWEAMRVLADDTCRPFSINRRGLVLGEGAGIFVLESLEHAQARGATILAELAGVGMTADATDIVMPSAEGSSAAMSQALADAGLKPRMSTTSTPTAPARKPTMSPRPRRSASRSARMPIVLRSPRPSRCMAMHWAPPARWSWWPWSALCATAWCRPPRTWTRSTRPAIWTTCRMSPARCRCARR